MATAHYVVVFIFLVSSCAQLLTNNSNIRQFIVQFNNCYLTNMSIIINFTIFTHFTVSSSTFPLDKNPTYHTLCSSHISWYNEKHYKEHETHFSYVNKLNKFSFLM